MTATPEDIRNLADRIAAEFHPLKVVLFGSHAQGRSHAGSDVDLLVILPFGGTAYAKALEILNLLNPPFSVDLIVRSPEDIAMRYRYGDPLIREVIDNGRVLYEVAA